MLEATITIFTLLVFSGLERIFPGASDIVHVGVAVFLAIYAIVGIAEAASAIRAPVPPEVREPAPSFTGIIAAYLPNEAPIIIETIEHHLEHAPPDLQLILAYNSPEPLPIEAELAMLADRDPRLVVFKVEDSRSKAENVNAALEIATGEVIGLFDADHHPAPGTYHRAWRWLAHEADVVQGRCVVRRPSGLRAWLPHLVSVELEQMYSVGHAGRTKLYGFGLFGGSNGYWRAEALRAIRFDPTALTEDIDASVRMLRSGGRIVTDPGIVSTELAPPTVSALSHQRLRWAQGWLQVRLRHLTAVITDGAIERRTRFGAGWTLGVGSIAPWVGALVMPLMIDGWFGAGSGVQGIVRPLVAFGTAGFLFQVAISFRHAVPAGRKAFLFVGYALANAVFYAYLRTSLVRLAHVHEFVGRDVWRVTPRTVARS